MEKNDLSILIIEDQKINTDLFFGAFGKQYHVIAAHSGEEGITVYEQHKPDLVFLDIGLPDMSGFDVLQKLRQIEDDVYVVMLSAMNYDIYVQRCKELGAKGFLTKPYKREYIEYYITGIKSMKQQQVPTQLSSS